MESINSPIKHVMKQVFVDHWLDYLQKHINTIPDYIVNEIEKMLNCRNPEKSGYHKYACLDHPEEYTVVPHSCKSRICSVCGVNQTNKWIEEALVDFPDTGYFHVTFTIPDYLWYFFKYQSRRPLLEILFQSAQETVMGWFLNRGIVPAAIAVLHTFGKKINYNTHIHIVVSAGGLKKAKKNKKEKSYQGYIWKDVGKLPWGVFRKRWKAIFLKKIDKYLNCVLEEAISRKQWYIHIRSGLANPIMACQYVGRYTKRPPMAETRITNYDGKFVTFYYDERQDNGWKKRERITLHAMEFIDRLIQHIPLPQFKMIRNYGILSNVKKSKLLNITSRLLGQTKKPLARSTWRMRQTEYLKRDPLLCKKCGKEMVLKEIAFWSKRDDKLYIKNVSLEFETTAKPRVYCTQKPFFHVLFTVFRTFLTLKTKFIFIRFNTNKSVF